MAGGTWNKGMRRFGFPLLVACTSLVYYGVSLSWLFASILWGLLLRLPFTLKGDSVQGSTLNFVWIWISGLLLGAPIILIDFSKWYLALIPMFVQGIFGTLSQTKEFQNILPWKFVECMIGTAVAIPICYLV